MCVLCGCTHTWRNCAAVPSLAEWNRRPSDASVRLSLWCTKAPAPHSGDLAHACLRMQASILRMLSPQPAHTLQAAFISYDVTVLWACTACSIATRAYTPCFPSVAMLYVTPRLGNKCCVTLHGTRCSMQHCMLLTALLCVQSQAPRHS